jgi:outer membrane protein assembly factor BamA
VVPGTSRPIGNDGLRVFDQFQGSDKMIRGFAYNGFGPVDVGGSAHRGNWYHLGGKTYFHARLKHSSRFLPCRLASA